MKLHFLKTIWSDLIVLERDGHFALVDTGMADQYPMLETYLKKLGAETIDFILITHFHRDHYGCVPWLLDGFRIGKVYLKAYSELDSSEAWGPPADFGYRESELWKYEVLRMMIREKSELVMLEETPEIEFAGVSMKLFFHGNTIREIYEDDSCPETYHQILHSENLNSVGIYFETDGVRVFLGGDLNDFPSPHPKADHVVRQIAETIGSPVDIYKAPHHGTRHTGDIEALSILKPKIAVITNGEKYLTGGGDAPENLRAANPDVQIYLTERADVVISAENGQAEVIESAGEFVQNA